MADQNTTQLTEATSVADTDLLYAVVDPAGTPADRKVTVANLLTTLSGPGAMVSRISALSIADSTVVDIPADNVEWDTDGFWSAGAPNKLTVPAGLGGRYVVFCALAYAGNGTGRRVVRVRKNLQTASVARSDTGAIPEPITLIGSAEVELAAGDSVGLQAFQDSGVSLGLYEAYMINATSDLLYSFLSIRKVA